MVKSTNSTIKSILGLAFSLSSGNGRPVAIRLLIIRKLFKKFTNTNKYPLYDMISPTSLVKLKIMHVARLFLAKTPIKISPVELK